MGTGFTWFHRCVQSRKGRFSPDGETRVLREKLEEKQRDVNYLKFQLTQTRADKFELEQRPTELRDVFAAILNEPLLGFNLMSSNYRPVYDTLHAFAQSLPVEGTTNAAIVGRLMNNIKLGMAAGFSAYRSSQSVSWRS